MLSNKSRPRLVLPIFFKVYTKFKTNIPLKESFSSKFFSTTNLNNDATDPDIKSEKKSKTFFKPQMIKKGFNIFLDECHKFYEEKRESYYLRAKYLQIRDPRHSVDMLYTFENEKNLKNFVVTTDSSNDGGYSSASLKITQSGTGLFSGCISTEVPKTGNVKIAGYANFMSHRQMKSFGMLSYFNWSHYTHLVLKVRGDGRTYLMVLSTPFGYEETKGYQFCHPFYTRGGPYWQVSRIPFSHFFFGDKGRVFDNQFIVPLNKIAKFGITIADGEDGPFKLEIDYIGLEQDPLHKQISPYELYKLSKNIGI